MSENERASGLSTGTLRFDELEMLAYHAKIIVEMTIGRSLDAGY
jgi:hypothetical protein